MNPGCYKRGEDAKNWNALLIYLQAHHLVSPTTPALFSLFGFSQTRAKRLARVGAFVIAVLENDGVARLPTHVIHVPVEWLDQWSFVRDAHQNPTCCRTLSTRLGLPEIAPVGSTSGPDSSEERATTTAPPEAIPHVHPNLAA